VEKVFAKHAETKGPKYTSMFWQIKTPSKDRLMKLYLWKKFFHKPCFVGEKNI